MPLYGRRQAKPTPGAGIDQGHPLAAGLVACWAFAEGAGLAVDTASGHQATAFTGTWGSSPSGPAVSFVNASSQWLNLGPSTGWLNVVGAITIAFLGNPPTSGPTCSVVDVRDSQSTLNGYGFSLNQTAANELDYLGGGAVGSVQSNSNTIDGSWHLYAMTVTSAGSVAFYRDGVPAGTGSHAAPTAWGGQSAIGARNDGLARFYQGSLAFAAIWSRVLASSELVALAVNPWQLFAPPRAWWFEHATAATFRPALTLGRPLALSRRRAGPRASVASMPVALIPMPLDPWHAVVQSSDSDPLAVDTDGAVLLDNDD